MTATARLGFRVSPEDRARIERAAELADETVSAFVRSAASERADRVLHAHDAATTVPPVFFDKLIAALDAPAHPNQRLTQAAARLDCVRRG